MYSMQIFHVFFIDFFLITPSSCFYDKNYIKLVFLLFHSLFTLCFWGRIDLPIASLNKDRIAFKPTFSQTSPTPDDNY